jgi:Protein of unknown function (DUF3225)
MRAHRRRLRSAQLSARLENAMSDLTPNIAEVVAEVRERFERYERALVDKEVEVLDDTFWKSPYTVPAQKNRDAGSRS